MASSYLDWQDIQRQTLFLSQRIEGLTTLGKQELGSLSVSPVRTIHLTISAFSDGSVIVTDPVKDEAVLHQIRASEPQVSASDYSVPRTFLALD